MEKEKKVIGNKRKNKQKQFKVPKLKNEYKVPVSYTVDRIDVSISPEEFFKQYVCKRKPAIFVNIIKDTNWKGKQWTNEYLKKKAGDCTVKVEKKSNNGAFGTGNPKITMKFRELIEEIEKGNDSLYLTTQYEEEEDSSNSEDKALRDLCPPPLNHLMGDFPLKPSLLGNLVPQQTNVWIGNSKEGTSSGLHHDYHDNLYILLRGRKRFTLFSPSDASNLSTYGIVEKIHPNGLINYKEGKPTRGDGAIASDVASWKIKKAESELSLLQQNGASAEEIAEAEQRVEDLLDGLLDGHDDFDDFDFGNIDSDENEGKKKKKQKKEVKNQKETKKSEPPSFSRIDTKTLHEPISPLTQKIFPGLEKANRVICEINEGEMLYLPASWFHEVSSFNSKNEKAEPGHIAFNFWMHPPTTDNFEQPYEDSFWLDEMEPAINKYKEITGF